MPAGKSFGKRRLLSRYQVVSQRVARDCPGRSAADYKLHLTSTRRMPGTGPRGRRGVHPRSAADLSAAISAPPGKVGRWIWRCHIDASRPDRAVWKHLADGIADYEATIFSMAFVYPALATVRCSSFRRRSIRLAEKNRRWMMPSAWPSSSDWESIPSDQCCCRSRASIDSRTRLGVIDAFRPGEAVASRTAIGAGRRPRG